MLMIQQKLNTNQGSFKMEPSNLSKYCGLILFFSLLMGCSDPSIQKLEGAAQGTTYHISYWSELPVDGKEIEAAVKNELDTIEDAFQLSA